MKIQFVELPIKTSAGKFVARYSEKGLAELDFPKNGKRVFQKYGAAISRQIQNWHRTTSRALARALTGRKPEKLPPLDLSFGTDFQQRVWNALRKIANGKTRSYSEIAQAIGKSKAVRAVGGACGANPIPILVPCHRVLAANGKLGGFSGGLNWKRTLLAREGVRFSGTTHRSA